GPRGSGAGRARRGRCTAGSRRGSRRAVTARGRDDAGCCSAVRECRGSSSRWRRSRTGWGRSRRPRGGGPAGERNSRDPGGEGVSAVEISASDVKALRDRTGAGMMDCKKALAEAGGDMEQAIELLRVRQGKKIQDLGE